MLRRKSRDFIWICFLLIWRADPSRGECKWPCRTCNLLNYCSSCVDGYYKNNWYCYLCRIENCETCRSDGLCDACMGGYTLVSGWCHCGGINNCKICNNRQCSTCMNGYYLDTNGNCLYCGINYCKTCKGYQQCTTCWDGYYLRTDKNCNSCDIDNCKTCEGYQQCTTCMDGYYLHTNGYCNSCDINNCKTCPRNNQCTTCMDGYILHQESCVTCQYLNPYCTSCSSQGVCSSCNDGYILNNDNNCFQCDATRCTTCSADYKCDSCKNGFILNSNKLCISCKVDHCYRCSVDNTCTICDTGYKLYGNKCYACTVDNCLYCSSDNFCVSCQKELYTNNGKCVSCDLNCVLCNHDGQCRECKPGFYANGILCIKCPVGCETCGGANSCYSCINSYRLMLGRCLICPDVCETCSDDNVCTECKNNDHYIYQNSCVECPDKCTRCLSDTDCTYCQQGYYGKNGCTETCPPQCSESYCKINGGCYSCDNGFHGEICYSTCPLNCTKCKQDNGHCLECKNGFYVNNGQCTKCPSNCVTCTSTHCEECVTGFYGRRCEHECTNCKPGTACDKSYGDCSEGCADGYTGKNCNTKCYEGCMSCQQSSYYQCDACLPGRYGYQYFNYNQCTEHCSSNCLNSTCEDKSGECTYGCVQGFYGKKCSDKCPENCADNVCHSNGTCVKCTEKFTGEKCKCPLNCNCNWNDICSSCKLGFGNEDLNCECTKEHCNDSDCTSCKSQKYFISDNTCCSCESQDNHCEQCSSKINGDYDKCEQCFEGFFPSRQKCSPCNENCVENKCHSRTGNCLNGCESGYWGEQCNQTCKTFCSVCNQNDGACTECNEGRFSSDCSKLCSQYCYVTGTFRMCAMEDGACLNGCKTMTMYGSHCQNDCSNNCTDSQCDWKTGHCVKGCHGNQYGDLCDLECSSTCLDSSSTLKDVCYDNNGTCTQGCLNGNYGNRCELKCNIDCVNMTCDQFTGTCLYGCNSGDCNQVSKLIGGMTPSMLGGIVGGIIAICLVVIIVVFVIRRRRKNGRNEENQARNDQDIPEYAVVHHDETDTEGIPFYAMPVKRNKENKQTIPSNTSNQSVASRDQAAHVTTEKVIEVPGAERKSVQLLEEELCENESADNGADGDDTYYNVCHILKRQIQLNKLQKYVATKTKEDYMSEFQSLPVGLIKSYDISRTKENASKNRYQGIYPYDDTLVVLKGANFTYMNASFIEGYQKKHAYIASMGPTIKYMKDLTPFWWMVWQEKVGKIVMLTRQWEAGINKCDQYWPNLDSQVTYGDLTVTSLSEMMYTDYAIRSFKLQKGIDSRMIQQVHYTAWPDKGTPDDVTSLVEFRQRVNSLQTSLDGPLLVHCSAGIGRTGTYIALDMLTNEGTKEGSVDILACVRNMREDRVNMVQTWDQYKFLHECLVYTLTYDCKPIDATGFHDYMKKHGSKSIGKKFQELQSTLESRSESEMLAVQRNSELTDKNRTGADIPGDTDRPRLYLGRTTSSSDYINALYLNSYKVPKHFIIAQTPLPSTVVDFLTLAVQEKCKLIINMDASISPTDNVGQYIPSHNEEDMTVGSFSVKVVSRKQDQLCSVTQCKIQYKNKTQSEQVDVTCVQFSRWPQTSKVPPDVVEFLQFVTEMTSLVQKSDPESPVLVHCLNGAARSGLFCLVCVFLEKVECCHEVSISNTVRQIKMKRPLAVNNQEQFKFCHDCINVHLERCDVYSNFSSLT